MTRKDGKEQALAKHARVCPSARTSGASFSVNGSVSRAAEQADVKKDSFVTDSTIVVHFMYSTNTARLLASRYQSKKYNNKRAAKQALNSERRPVHTCRGAKARAADKMPL
jgi:hypothetical protein